MLGFVTLFIYSFYVWGTFGEFLHKDFIVIQMYLTVFLTGLLFLSKIIDMKRYDIFFAFKGN